MRAKTWALKGCANGSSKLLGLGISFCADDAAKMRHEAGNWRLTSRLSGFQDLRSTAVGPCYATCSLWKEGDCVGLAGAAFSSRLRGPHR